MGWNKHSSGSKYNSMSGNRFLLGAKSRKVLKYKCILKQCSKCTMALKRSETPEPHECPKNYSGSSKSMEMEAIFRFMQEDFHECNNIIATIIGDDDSTMRSNLKQSFAKKK